MSVSAVSQHLTPQMVSQAAVRVADSDGDGRTGAAALNDGDAAAHAAARQLVQGPAPAAAKAPVGHVDVKACGPEGLPPAISPAARPSKYVLTRTYAIWHIRGRVHIGAASRPLRAHT